MNIGTLNGEKPRETPSVSRYLVKEKRAFKIDKGPEKGHEKKIHNSLRASKVLRYKTNISPRVQI